ncbi:hypothetical protein J7355_10065 [Endozoicomonas sp. G2_2]|nr:hypothetical protein [Endozoicomonas sp. G2_2]MBO9470444.1 hypothetical protein [Endozoicomonas sp. G2_2]
MSPASGALFTTRAGAVSQGRARVQSNASPQYGHRRPSGIFHRKGESCA